MVILTRIERVCFGVILQWTRTTHLLIAFIISPYCIYIIFVLLDVHCSYTILPFSLGYISTLRNNVRSRAWGAAIGCSYRVERCCIVKKGGGTIALEPCLTHTSTLEPTLAPVVVERTMTTRAAASARVGHLDKAYLLPFVVQNALRQQRFVREVTIQYNLCNEPWYTSKHFFLL
ncbi:hypothetical protein C3L33_18394, partial [Rhododendron williamsianum]